MKIKKILILVTFSILFFYIFWHFMYSKKGALSLFVLSREKEHLQRENKELNDTKTSLEKKTNRMKSDSLDLDLLDEQARKNLGYSKEKEMVYVE